MDIILTILQKLGADQSFFCQFAIFTITYFIAAPLFFKPLFKVLNARREATTGVMERANQTMNNSLKLEEDYNAKKDAMKRELLNDLQNKKAKILEAKKEELHQHERELEGELESKKLKYNSELNEKRDSILGETSEISKELVERLS